MTLAKSNLRTSQAFIITAGHDMRRTDENNRLRLLATFYNFPRRTLFSICFDNFQIEPDGGKRSTFIELTVRYAFINNN